MDPQKLGEQMPGDVVLTGDAVKELFTGVKGTKSDATKALVIGGAVIGVGIAGYLLYKHFFGKKQIWFEKDSLTTPLIVGPTGSAAMWVEADSLSVQLTIAPTASPAFWIEADSLTTILYIVPTLSSTDWIEAASLTLPLIISPAPPANPAITNVRITSWPTAVLKPGDPIPITVAFDYAGPAVTEAFHGALGNQGLASFDEISGCTVDSQISIPAEVSVVNFSFPAIIPTKAGLANGLYSMYVKLGGIQSPIYLTVIQIYGGVGPPAPTVLGFLISPMLGNYPTGQSWYASFNDRYFNWFTGVTENWRGNWDMGTAGETGTFILEVYDANYALLYRGTWTKTIRNGKAYELYPYTGLVEVGDIPAGS
jgi:hypothetical protein